MTTNPAPSGPVATVSSVLRLEEPLSRGPYAAIGFGLMAVKYLVEAGLVWAFTSRLYQPLDFLNPLLGVREKYFQPPAPDWLGWAMVIWSIPFLCIATTMSVRRSIDAGVGPWMGLWIFVPGINFALMLVLCLLPSAPRPIPVIREAAVRAARSIGSSLLGAMAGAVVGLVMLSFSVYGLGDYGLGLFMGSPLLVGTIAAWRYNRPVLRGIVGSLLVAQLAILLCGAFLLLFAFEGVICLVMLYPIAAVMALVGGLVGYTIAKLAPERPTSLGAPLLLLPLVMGAERMYRSVPTYEVCTAVEIDAPPAVVWPHVVGFSELPAPPAWYFRLGIAYPKRATIDGAGVGAVRHCEFSTGAFVEPITAWDPPRRLAFDVASQPPPMHELSPYRHVHPPHLDGYLRCRRGEFRLIPLADGRTRLEGSTWYEYEIYPQAYWTLWSDLLIHRIHSRVLDHIKRSSEAGAPSPP